MKMHIGGLVLGLAALAGSANAQFAGTSGAIGNIPDSTAAGVNSTINVPGNFVITGIAVKLNTTSHSWVGDFIVKVTAPNGNVAMIMNRTGVGVASSTVGDSSDPIGSYRFTDRTGAQNFSALGGGILDISLAAAGTPGGNWWSEAGVAGAPAPNSAGGAAYIMRSGDYIASGNSGAGTTYAARYTETNLLSLLGSQSQGNWTINISDNAAGDTGSVANWSLQLLPSPGASGLFALAGLAGLRRRR